MFSNWGGTLRDTQAPTAATSLASTAKTATSITVSWNASSDNVAVTGYNIYANNVLKSTVSSLNYTITGLTGSTAYSIYVTARDAAGNTSGSSNVISVTTNAGGGTGNRQTIFYFEYMEGSEMNQALEMPIIRQVR